MKKIISMVGVLALTGASLLSSVSADESMETNETTSVSTTESEKSEGETTSTEEGTVATQEASTATATTEVTSTTSATPNTSNNMNADRNNDGSVDMYEQCAFVQKKSEENCSSAKETMKKKMWEQYGSGTYNPNAFERNQNHGIIMKKMNEENRVERKEMRQEMKDAYQEVKNQVQTKKQEVKQMIQTKKRALSEKLHGQLTVAIEKLSVERLNKVLANIDKAVTKVTTSSLSQEKKDRLLAQLEEIRVIIQDKVAALTGGVSEGNILTDILSGTESTTPAADTTTGAVTQ